MPTMRVKAFLVGLGVSLATAVLMLATLPRMAIGWDEGYTLGREARLRDWFRGLRDPVRFAAQYRPLPPDQELVQEASKTPVPRANQLDSRSKLLFNHEVLEWFWPFAREEPHGHPAFYALLGLAGDLLAPSWQDLPRARLGPILLFSLTAGAIYCFVIHAWGVWSAALAAGSWVLQPQLFGHGHYAAYDAILTSLWVLSIIAFAQAVIPDTNPDSPRQPTRWGWTLAFGLVARLRGGDQVHGLVSALAVLGLVVSLPQSSRVQDTLVGRLDCDRGTVGTHAPVVDRSGQRRHAVPRIQPEPGQDDPDPG